MRSARLNDIQPVLKLGLLPSLTCVPHQDEQRAVTKEELMSGVVNILAAEVP